jgi:LmbE family N-acetylglucosaminyl deacetylase
MDGELLPSLALRKEAVLRIRQYAPQIIVTSDPQNYVTLDNQINHPDHRAAGEIVLGAAFPAAGNPQIYKSLTNEIAGIPVSPEEIWISATNQPNLNIDITNYYDAKLEAIGMHASQIGEKDAFIEKMKSRSIIDPTTKFPIFVERFKHAILK